MADLFGEVLTLCASSGLVEGGVIAVDGTKLHANASRTRRSTTSASRARSSRRPGDRRGRGRALSGRPRRRAAAGGGDRAGPPGWFREAKRGWMPSARERRADRRVIGRSASRRPSGAWMSSSGGAARQRGLRGLPGARADRRTGGVSAEHRSPTSRRQCRRARSTSPIWTHASSRDCSGWLQGYNAQAVTNEHQIVIAAEIQTVVHPTSGTWSRCVDRRPPRAGRPSASATGPPWWSPTPATGTPSRCNGSSIDGIAVLIPPDSSLRTTPRPGWNGGLYAFMRHVLRASTAAALYRQRQPMIEPVFGQIKHNRGLDRFHRRGRAAVRTEWRLITATHNLLKLHRHTLATA